MKPPTRPASSSLLPHRSSHGRAASFVVAAVAVLFMETRTARAGEQSKEPVVATDAASEPFPEPLPIDRGRDYSYEFRNKKFTSDNMGIGLNKVSGILELHSSAAYERTTACLTTAERRHNFYVARDLLKSAHGGKGLAEGSYCFPAVVTTEFLVNPFGGDSFVSRGWYATAIREIGVPYSLKALTDLCREDYKRRHEASHLSAVAIVEKALRTDQRVKPEDRNRDAAKLLATTDEETRRAVGGGGLNPLLNDTPVAVVASRDICNEPRYLIRGPLLPEKGSPKGFSIVFEDKLSLSYNTVLSLNSSAIPRAEYVLEPKRHLGVAYDFDPEGRLQAVRVWCPAEKEVIKMPVSEGLLATAKGKVPGNERDRIQIPAGKAGTTSP
ncbi:MAG: hypothetical protein ACO3JG_13365 [Luteolibacter sp.]